MRTIPTTSSGTVLETEIVNFVGVVVVGGGGSVETVDADELERRRIASFCKPLERGGSIQEDCVAHPEVWQNAIINVGFSFEGAPITIPVVPNNHVSDGTFGAAEWDHVTPAIGRFTNAYIDYADGFLYILNDWIYNPVTPVANSCYNLFTAFTGSGQQTWSIRVYGSGLVEVELNGELLTQEKTNATGAIGFGVSPKKPVQKHSIFELAFAALPGTFGVQLHVR